MLHSRGQQVFGTAVALCAVGLMLSLPGVLTVGCLLLAALLLQLQRLRAGLRPLQPPWSVRSELEPRVGEASTASLHKRSHQVGSAIPLQLHLKVDAAFSGVTLHIDGWETTAGLDLLSHEHTIRIENCTATVSVTASAKSAAVHRVHGLRGQLVDAMGLLCAPVFLPCQCEIASLPRSLPLDLRRLAETRRHAARSAAGSQPDNAAGHGDELREIREHVFGDPFKHIAWKASARRGRLMSRVFERERSRAVYVVLDSGTSMREGRLGDSALDQAVDLTHSLAELAARMNLPFGASLVDGRVTATVRVREGLVALKETDRALLDLRRVVAEDLAPLSDEALVHTVAAYLRAVQRVKLEPPRGNSHEAQLRFRQRTVMAALARLPERERLPTIRGAEPSKRADISILRRFCRAMDLCLPYRSSLPATERVAGLTAGVKAAVNAKSGPFVIVVMSDFRGLLGALSSLFATLAQARKKGHRALLIAMQDGAPEQVIDYLLDAEDLDTARGLAQADRAARTHLLRTLDESCRRVGAGLLADPDPNHVVAQWAAIRG